MKIAAIKAYPYTHKNVATTKKQGKKVIQSNNSHLISFGAKMPFGGIFGGATGAAIGYGIGTAITALTGGAAAPFIAVMAGTAAGSMGGNMIEESRSNCSDNSDYDDFDDTYFDIRSWP